MSGSIHGSKKVVEQELRKIYGFPINYDQVSDVLSGFSPMGDPATKTQPLFVGVEIQGSWFMTITQPCKFVWENTEDEYWGIWYFDLDDHQ